MVRLLLFLCHPGRKCCETTSRSTDCRRKAKGEHMNQTRRNSQQGFTLIEIIITFVIMAWTGAMLFQFMNTTIPVSNQPADWILHEAQIGSAMEDATAEYLHNVHDDTLTSDYDDFITDLHTSVTSLDVHSNVTVLAEQRCFNANGDLVATCADDQVPLLRVRSQDPNGRYYVTLFAQTRHPNDPKGAH